MNSPVQTKCSAAQGKK